MVCFNCKRDTPGDSTTEKTEAPAADGIDNKTVLQINERKFSNSDFKLFLQLQYPDISTSRKNSSSNPSIQLLSRLFDSFVENKIVLYIADQHDIPVDKAELDQYIDKLTADDETAPKNNIDTSSVIDAIRVQKFLLAKVYESVTVSEMEIRDYYNIHIEDFRKKPEVLLYQILLKDKEAALKVRGVLDNNPQKFEELAKQESISTEAQEGGLMGYFEEGTLPKDMEQVVFSLSPQTISPVVESAYGFHIFKVTQKKKGRLLYLEKVKPEIKQKLMSEKLRNAYRDFLGNAARELDISMKYNDLFFEYQKNEGEKQDETKETNTNDLSNSSG